MIRKQIKWLIENMDPPYRKKQLKALCICVFTCVLLLVNPALSRRLIDDVIVAGNPDPLLSILGIMLAVMLPEGTTEEDVEHIMGQAAETAAQLGFDCFTTTLTISPLKDADRLNRIGEEIGVVIHVQREELFEKMHRI